jgi:integrator complex subunit 3
MLCEIPRLVSCKIFVGKYGRMWPLITSKGDISENCIPELIRYIVCVFHPDNNMLAADLVPRWAVISWLLKSCKVDISSCGPKLQSTHAIYSAKEALMYDIFFFNQNDKVMNIEPAILLMMQNALRSPELTSAFLDFILIEIDKYEKVTGSEGKIKLAVQFAFEFCQKVGVVK